MSQSEGFENQNNGNEENGIAVATYMSQSSEDVYHTPDVSAVQPDADSVEVACDVAASEANMAAETVDDGGSYEESKPAVPSVDGVGNSPYGNSPYVGQGTQGNPPYGSPYGNNSYGGQRAQSNSPYGNPYDNNPYGGQGTQSYSPYGNSPYGNPSYGGQGTQNHNPYGNPSYGGQSTWNNHNAYGPDNSQHYGSTPGNNQYGVPPYGNNPYSPYAAPEKKNHVGLIIGIVVAIIVLFIIAVGALAYKVVSLYAEENSRRQNARDEYNFDDDDWERDPDREYYDDDWYGYDDYGYDDYDYDYNYDDYGYDDYDYDNEEYYTLHDDIRTDLAYSVEFDYYEYESDYDNVDILVSYPIIEGEQVPNLEQLNNEIQSEIDVITEYFEEEYEEYLTEDDYFSALSTGYVTYMDEEKMSVVFSEYVYSDYYNEVYLYCINIDMENGVILDNENILHIDDEFSVEFRTKSDIQNDEIPYLTMMSDQEMTDYFNSSDLIVFYTPKGMEIGFNYDEGWVTVTYEDYEKYLRVF